MERFKKILKKIFCLLPLWTILASLFGYGFVIAVAVFDIRSPVLQYASYLASAYALVVTCTGLVYVNTAIDGVKRFISNRPLIKKLRSTAVGEKYMTDVRFRAGVSLYQGFFVNLLYIVMKLVSGIVYRSAWFIALAVYYILLAVMRFLLMRRLNARDEDEELRRYRLCGIMLLFMNQALTGIVVFMVHQNRGFNYPGLLIYAMAAYAFYAVTVAIINIVKTRRHNSPILSAARALSLVAAMVSILSLTTAMLTQFGGDGNADFNRTMTGAVGGGVCTIVIGMAIYMIWRANRSLKKLEINNSQT